MSNAELDLMTMTPTMNYGSMKDIGGEEQCLSNVKVMCRLYFSSENEGGERTRKMMSWKSCGKKKITEAS